MRRSEHPHLPPHLVKHRRLTCSAPVIHCGSQQPPPRGAGQKRGNYCYHPAPGSMEDRGGAKGRQRPAGVCAGVQIILRRESQGRPGAGAPLRDASPPSRGRSAAAHVPSPPRHPPPSCWWRCLCWSEHLHQRHVLRDVLPRRHAALSSSCASAMPVPPSRHPAVGGRCQCLSWNPPHNCQT